MLVPVNPVCPKLETDIMVPAELRPPGEGVSHPRARVDASGPGCLRVNSRMMLAGTARGASGGSRSW